MTHNTIAIAQAYYTAVGEKNIPVIEAYLHPDVSLTAPFGTLTGKDAVLDAIKGFTNVFKTLTIRAEFGSENQAVIVYDLDCPTLKEIISAAVLMTFDEGLITNIETFYDPRPFA